MVGKILATASAVALLAAATAARAEMPSQINFGIISTESSANLQKSFQPLLDDMTKALKVDVKPFFASDYAGVIEGMRFNKVDIAWFGNKSAMVAVDRAGGEIFAQTIKDDGSRGYYSLLITHADSPLNSLEDVLKCDKSLAFGNGDPNSTSGFLVPSYYVFARNDASPDNCFKTVLTSNHEGNALAVANKKVDVATNNTESLGRLAANRPEDRKKIKEIWRSPLIPSDPIVWRSNLDADVKEKIYYFFMSYGRFGDMEKIARERKVLAHVSDGWGPFLASSDAQLIPIRQLELFKNKLKIQNDEKLAADEKKKKIAEIDSALAELSKFGAVIGNSGS